MAAQGVQMPIVMGPDTIDRIVAFVVEQPQEKPLVEADTQLFHYHQKRTVGDLGVIEPANDVAPDAGVVRSLPAPSHAGGREGRAFAAAIVETGAHRGRKRILDGHETAGSKLAGDCIDIHDPAIIPRPRLMH